VFDGAKTSHQKAKNYADDNRQQKTDGKGG
jgi:hypothetical protein